MPGRHLPPVVVLASDGYPSDDFEAGLDAFFKAEHAAAAIRLAIAIGGKRIWRCLSALSAIPRSNRCARATHPTLCATSNGRRPRRWPPPLHQRARPARPARAAPRAGAAKSDVSGQSGEPPMCVEERLFALAQQCRQQSGDGFLAAAGNVPRLNSQAPDLRAIRALAAALIGRGRALAASPARRRKQRSPPDRGARRLSMARLRRRSMWRAGLGRLARRQPPAPAGWAPDSMAVGAAPAPAPIMRPRPNTPRVTRPSPRPARNRTRRSKPIIGWPGRDAVELYVFPDSRRSRSRSTAAATARTAATK